MDIASLAVILLAGFAGSFHCVGMCGGFACGLGTDPGGSPLKTVVRHVLYNSGRWVSYVMIGALAGALGAFILSSGPDTGSHAGHRTGHGTGAQKMTSGAHDNPADHGAAGHEHSMSGMTHDDAGYVLTGNFGVLQRVLSVLAGILMLVMALQLFGVLRHRPHSRLWLGGNSFAAAMRALLKSKNPGVPVTLGVINGFLPCPLVYAFAAMAAASGSAISGMLTMAAFGLGTFPAMLFMGSAGRAFSLGLRQNGVRLAGGFVFVFGFVTVLRGVVPSVLHFPWHGA